MLTDASFGIIPIRRDESTGETQFLLIQHRRGKHWAFPKGHAEGNETAIQSAERELREETGLRAVSVRRDRDFVEQYLIENHIIKTVRYWLADVEGGKVFIQKEEVQDYVWLSLADARQRLTFFGSRALLELAAQHLGLSPPPEINILPDADALMHRVVDLMKQSIREAVAARGVCHLALAGGTTPLKAYARLARQDLPWTQTHFWWGDERCVPPDHAESNYAQARAALLDIAPIPAQNIHRIKGELQPREAAFDYCAQLAAQGERFALDIALLGLGDDGHTASLFPWQRRPDECTKPAVFATAYYQGRPAQRVSLTPLIFNAARSVLFLVSGQNKAAAVAATLKGPCNPSQYPAQMVYSYHGCTRWLIDAAAARGMEYF